MAEIVICNESAPYFKAEVIVRDTDPVGFQTWAAKMEQCKYIAYLADGTTIDVQMFIDMNDVFDNGSYTNFLLNRYNEL